MSPSATWTAPSDPAEDGDYPPRPHSSTNGAFTILPCATEWLRGSPIPLRCLTDPADFDERALDAIRKVYVRHTAPPLPSLDMSLGIAVAAGWEIHEVACGHDLMLAAPDETAALLDVISRGPG